MSKTTSEPGAPAARRFLPPRVNAETMRFWAAAQERKLLYGYCNACHQTHYYPRTLCPYCFSDETQWKAGSGNAVVYTYSIMYRSPTGPYVIAYVTLAEGPSILTNLIDCDFERIKIGSPVKLVWRATEGDGTPPLPFFTVV
jgi:uncharacterized OB-fold protein